MRFVCDFVDATNITVFYGPYLRRCVCVSGFPSLWSKYSLVYVLGHDLPACQYFEIWRPIARYETFNQKKNMLHI